MEKSVVFVFFLLGPIYGQYSDQNFKELSGGSVSEKELTLEKGNYVLREDLIIENSAQLHMEPGVHIKFGPNVGITVRGSVTAQGTREDKIVLSSLGNPVGRKPSSGLRLVDGPSTLSGRLQIFHSGKWRSICSNSNRWRREDAEVACRQMGWSGGSWRGWVERSPASHPRLLLLPNCAGTELTLSECRHAPIQMGGPTCDYHPDVAIDCYPQHIPSTVKDHWRGLRFENAKFFKQLTLQNTLYVPISESSLKFVEIRHAGVGKDYNATSAIEVIGVAPRMSSLTIVQSAFNGINVTEPYGPFHVHYSNISSNNGYGIFVNSSNGGVQVEGCSISENAGDGVRYVSHDAPWEPREISAQGGGEVWDLCTLPTTPTQTFPLNIALKQSYYSANSKYCKKYFFARSGFVLTVNFLPIITDRNGSCHVSVYDGISSNDRLLASFDLYNNTKPQSVTTTRNNVFIEFSAEAMTETLALLRITSGIDKWTDLNVSDSTIAENSGRGIGVDNLRSRLNVLRTSVSYNNHVAGVHVSNGAGQVNISDSRISYNIGDGVNISFAGGSTNVSRTSLSSNQGHGIAVWFNETDKPDRTEFLVFNQSTVIEYSEVFKNIETGVKVGNFCRNSIVNVTGNWFNSSLDTALQIDSCWKLKAGTLQLYIGHNRYVNNQKLGIKIRPAVNLNGLIEFNSFTGHSYGGILVRNDPLEEFIVLPSQLTIRNNEFYDNRGVFVVNIGLSAYSHHQSLLFTWNFIKNNRIKQPFDTGESEVKALNPRSRVAAPVVVSSANTAVFRNIIQNHDSQYEIGVHLQDQSQVINCTYNWLGFSSEEKIFYRLFDRKDRYNLAKIQYLPYLLHNSNPGASTIMSFGTYVPEFNPAGGNRLGGEVDGLESLRPGEYLVERDINLRPGGRLTIQPGVTLRFPAGVGIMVNGMLEARGKGPNDILMTLREEQPKEEESTTLMDELPKPLPEEQTNVRLIGGATANEGTLQVKIGSQWGTVCNYGWTQRAASLVCNQLGLVLNPNDWLLYPSDLPHPGTNDPILLTNVRCDDDDLDITKCKSEKKGEFENACSHMQDVLMRCYTPHWAGMRLGVLADRSHLQYITIEKAGVLDYATSQFKAALQIDLSRHALENVRLTDNALDGLGVIYSDIFAMGTSNTIKNCDLSNNKGSGAAFKQLGMKITGSRLENNRVSGLRHDPWITPLSQRELAGWFKPPPDLSVSPQYAPYIPVWLPQSERNIELEEGQSKFLITQRVSSDLIEVHFYIKTHPGLVLGIQLLNPILNRSTEVIQIHDAPDLNTEADVWNVGRDLTVFPATSSSYGVVLMYSSGTDALGMTVIAVSAFRNSRQHYLRDKSVRGIIPTTTVLNSRIKGNSRGIWATHYNRYLTELGDHYLRKANESLEVIHCDISHNEKEAIYVDSPYWSVEKSNISEVSFIINNSLITDNGRGILHFSRDLRNSTNLFHWLLSDNSIERNSQGGLELSLPYVWSYNENFTHSVFLRNNTWRNNRNFGLTIGGHFARVNITENLFEENKCKAGLISLQGMEKMLNIRHNTIERNSGSYMIEFKADSQSEILGNVYAVFSYNLVKRNSPIAPQIPSSVILMNGVQKVRVRRNLVSGNSQGYALVAGIKTAHLDSSVDVSENWWGSIDPTAIAKLIFDFDDWNDHAIAIYSPFLVEDSFEGSVSVNLHPVNTTELGGRLSDSLRLYKRSDPYQVISDLTILPNAVLTIDPGVILEFAPRVGILVLGQLIAKGKRGDEIVMRPSSLDAVNPPRRLQDAQEMVRLCEKTNSCSGWTGWVERWNVTTQQWVPVCDSRWAERNTEVACRQLGRDSLDISTAHGRRYDLTPAETSAIWSWHEPLQCTGEEERLEDCEIRLNGQVYGHYHTCSWDSDFVFIDCGQPSKYYNNWGGIRFANSEFEQSNYEHRIHDSETHTTLVSIESRLQYVNITGAGLLHSVKSPAVLAVAKTPVIRDVYLSQSAHDGISFISPNQDVSLLFSRIEKSLGVGVSVASLTGEGRESGESSYNPLKHLPLPYWTFSFVDVCDPNKEIIVQERVVLYYKYDNRPINCVKIFHSAYLIKPFGFRLLQFNLLNSTDRIDLYDGSLYNRSMEWITTIDSTSPGRKFVTSRSPSLSIRLVASAASQDYGFLAEIVTLPISAIGFNRDVQHNVSYSILTENKGGGVEYVSAGEVNPRITLEYNQITNNCRHLYGNFTTCLAPVLMDLQNTQNLHFRNNLVQNNVGGLNVIADSRGTATALKGWVHNNLFADNIIQPSLSFESRQSSPYQQVTIYHNYWTRNIAEYHNIINLNQVVSNFTYNYLHDNEGSHILEVSGFERVRLPIYQSTSHNGFYWNRAVERDSKSTIVAGTAGQHYVDNIFFNPHNDYEMITVSRSLLDVWQSPIDARHNYWSYNETLAVMGRIRDRSDRPDLLQVDFSQYLKTNESILDGKCPPAWSLVGDTCYIYIGAPMGFFQARHFCRSANASMPYLMGNYGDVYKFLKRQQENFRYWDRIWVQHIDKINMCTAFVFSEVRLDECHHLNPFICEMDPKVIIDALSWKSDVVAVAMLGCVILAILLVVLVALFWFSKSRHRHAQRLERRNSIRQSLNSVRSIGSVQGFNSMYRGSRIVSSGQSSPTLNKTVDYKKMSGSVDSIEKSQFNSSNEEDTQSYDIYEAHNPTLPNPASLHLSFRNQGFKDNSTLPSRDTSAWQSTDDFSPHDTSTLPLASPTFTDSTVDIMKPEYKPEYQVYYERPKSSALLETDVDTSVPKVRPRHAKSEAFLETDFDSPYHQPHSNMTTFQALSKSQPLETAM